MVCAKHPRSKSLSEGSCTSRMNLGVLNRACTWCCLAALWVLQLVIWSCAYSMAHTTSRLHKVGEKQQLLFGQHRMSIVECRFWSVCDAVSVGVASSPSAVCTIDFSLFAAATCFLLLERQDYTLKWATPVLLFEFFVVVQCLHARYLAEHLLMTLDA